MHTNNKKAMRLMDTCTIVCANLEQTSSLGTDLIQNLSSEVS